MTLPVEFHQWNMSIFDQLPRPVRDRVNETACGDVDMCHLLHVYRHTQQSLGENNAVYFTLQALQQMEERWIALTA